MRMRLSLSCFLFLVACSIFTSALYAGPERLQIKTKEKRTQEALAESEAKQVDLSKIEDPEARKALKALFNTLGLSGKE